MEAYNLFIWFAAIAIVIASFISIIINIRNVKKIRELRRQGTQITALIIKVAERTINTGIIGGPIFQHTNYEIHAIGRNPLTGDIHIFRSGWLSFKPQELFEGNLVTIFIDINHPRRYYVDLSGRNS